MAVRLLLGDAYDVLRTIESESVDSVVTDPPYGIRFMGHKWDCDVPKIDVWKECLRVLKPGGHLLAFAGTRTQHRIAVGIEDAGFEIRDIIAWVYGQGFPKSKNLDGDWRGWGSALKPSMEPITVARKPFSGCLANNVFAHGTGALNIDGCRVEPTGESRERIGEASQERRYTEVGVTNFSATPGVRGGAANGRWPANLIHDGSDDVRTAFPDAKGQCGDLKETGKPRPSSGRFGDMAPPKAHAARIEADTSAARFFYCAKASKAERGHYNDHPTVKPVALMRYLCRLITPPRGTVLDMFMGSGSTGKAAVMEGFSFIGIDNDHNSLSIADRRIREAEEE